ncbi:copper chaperone PCu(A)C [Falsirhodobacter sp. 20TX0035]|uniref:copper chaperone PCu(A)C n=1 Tax=Falsirhodobacter sp. 20TX0035 TaxID=3022019 RepID=UPI00232C8466|nr:copper chaperone PCu(A)C [Falsirhodobacter sp. 20TX0035]MDB6452910.1 copper chaperone PCu(A)C [Falsirhodobacter sp. 20TX0035]
MLRPLTLVLSLALAGPALAQDANPIAVRDAFARATLPGAPVGGVYMTLTNTGAADDRLVSATTDAAQAVSLHEMVMKDDTMRMAPLPDGLPLPAGEAVALAPSGKHLMLENLAKPLVQGATIDVTLTFEQAAPLTIAVPVMAVNAGKMQHHHH